MRTLRHSINASAEMYYLSGNERIPTGVETRQGEGLFGTYREILILLWQQKNGAKICQKSGCPSDAYPVRFEIAIIKYHDGDLFTTVKPPNPVIVHFLHVSEPVTGEIVLHVFEKLYLLG